MTLAFLLILCTRLAYWALLHYAAIAAFNEAIYPSLAIKSLGLLIKLASLATISYCTALSTTS